MTDFGWRARVETRDGEVIGAGFLVDASRVLTCAHVVHGYERVQVVFPGLTGGLPATVVACTSWSQQGDTGDVAVLRLDVSVDIEPAVFAPVDALRRSAVTELGAYGFPWHKDDSGSVVELRTRSDMDLRQEWWQLNVPDAHLETLEHGFSGAAVYLVETGEVVGMATDRDKKLDGAGGRMLPLRSIRAHWEDVDDLLDLGWLTRERRHGLRLAVVGATTAVSLNALHREIFPGMLSVRPLRSVWDAIRYVAEEHLQEDALRRFLVRLTPHLDEPARKRLNAWTRRQASAPAHAQPPPPTSLIIRLDRMTRGGTYELTLLTLVDGVTGPSTNPVEVREEEIRGRVEEALPSVVGAALNPSLIIEFALPVSLFGEPFETWSIEDGIKMRVYPVVLRDVQRMNPGSIRRDLTMRRWQRLRRRGTTSPERIACRAPYADDLFQDWLDAEEECGALTYAASPSRGQLNAALNAGIPVMLWPRSRCADEAHDGCDASRRLALLTDAVASVHPDELPQAVKRVRKRARLPHTAEARYGRELTLVWDDPARLPDPPLAMGV